MLTLALYWPVEKLWAALVAGMLILVFGMTSAWQRRRNPAHALGGVASAVFGGLVAVWGARMLTHVYFG